MATAIEQAALSGSHRLTDSQGLGTLAELQHMVKMDSKRASASAALNKSMETWIARKSPNNSQDLSDFDVTSRTGSNRMSIMAPRQSRISTKKLTLNEECILNLEQAFNAHSAAFDIDGDGTICVEELIIIFDRCHLFDEFFTPNRVRNYFTTWVDGCNHMHVGRAPLSDDGIGYDEFKRVLQWAADMKAIPLGECAQKVVRLSRKLCDKSASVQRRLEVVFDAACKKDPTHLSAFEFGGLCQKVGAYENDDLTLGDVYGMFYKINGQVEGNGVDFDGFIRVLKEIGEALAIGEDVYAMFAKGVELLDSDEETITRVKMRMRHAALIVGGTDWQSFFYGCDPDGSGNIDWDEFVAMCRDKLHLADRDNHLRILFDRLDDDGSGELDIGELISFISE